MLKMIILDDGKYTFYKEDHILYCDRYGESWRDFCGDNAVTELFNECLELRKKLTHSKESTVELLKACKAVNKWLFFNTIASNRPAKIDKILMDAINKTEEKQP